MYKNDVCIAKNILFKQTSLEPRIIVVSCDLSPHSAKNVIEKDCNNIGEQHLVSERKSGFLRMVDLMIPVSTSVVVSPSS